MKVSFTGTRRGMTERQKQQLRELLLAVKPLGFSHGCCQGADIEAHEIVREVLGKSVFVAVFPSNSKTSAPIPEDANFVADPKSPLDRDKDIVAVGRDLLIAAPLGMVEAPRGGTWHTVRIARKMGVQVKLLLPFVPSDFGLTDF